MALEKNFVSETNGSEGNYWRIINYTDNRKAKINLNVACYKNKEFRDNLDESKMTLAAPGGVFIGVKNFKINKPESEDYIAGAYEALKLDPFFEGALDV